MTALSKLSGAIETHYQRLQRHVEAKAIGAGLLHNAAVSRAGEVWTWGDGSEGRHGQGIEAPFTKPELLMLARPNSDDELLLSKRFESTQVDLMSHASLRSDWGCVEMHNGGYLLFDQAMGPKELGFSVARIVYWAAEYCTIILRRLDIEGPVVATLDLTPCRPLPEDRFEDAAQAEKRSQVFQVRLPHYRHQNLLKLCIACMLAACTGCAGGIGDAAQSRDDAVHQDHLRCSHRRRTKLSWSSDSTCRVLLAQNSRIIAPALSEMPALVGNQYFAQPGCLLGAPRFLLRVPMPQIHLTRVNCEKACASTHT